MSAAKTREEARKRWSEIVAEMEEELQKLQREIVYVRTEKESLNRATRLARTRYQRVKDLESSATASLQAAEGTKKAVEVSKSAVDDLATKAEKLQRDIETIQARARSNNKLISDQLDQADKAALSGDFKEYANSYRKRADVYSVLVVLTIVVLVSILLRSKLLDLPAVLHWADIVAYLLKKIAFAAPFVYLVYLFSRLQSEARRLERQYRFKSAVALSLKSNKELLSELYAKEHLIKDSKGEATYPVADFAEGVIINNIYSIPDEERRAEPSDSDAPSLSFWANRQTKRALGLLREFSEIVKNIR